MSACWYTPSLFRCFLPLRNLCHRERVSQGQGVVTAICPALYSLKFSRLKIFAGRLLLHHAGLTLSLYLPTLGHLYAWAERTWPAMQWAQLIGVAYKTRYLWLSWAVPNNLEHTEASFLKNSMDSLCLQVAWMPRSQDLAIFVLTTDDRQNRLLYPLRMPACQQGKNQNWNITEIWR